MSTAGKAAWLLKESGLSANQIGRLLGVTRRAVHHWAAGSTPSPPIAARLTELHTLVTGLPAQTPEQRRILLLDSSAGPSLFRRFHNTTPRPQRIQHDSWFLG